MSAKPVAIPSPTETIECPLCLGAGRLKRTEILDRLGVKDFARVAQLSAEEAFRLLTQKHRHEEQSAWARFETELAKRAAEMRERHKDELRLALSEKDSLNLTADLNTRFIFLALQSDLRPSFDSGAVFLPTGNYSLVRQKSKSGAIPKLSSEAEEVLSLIQEQGQIVTGDVRKLLGIPSFKTSDDPAYVVLNELQRHLLIDRGPFKISNQAIPSLSQGRLSLSPF